MSPVGQCADRPARVTDLKRHLANQHIVGKHVGFLKPVDKGVKGCIILKDWALERSHFNSQLFKEIMKTQLLETFEKSIQNIIMLLCVFGFFFLTLFLSQGSHEYLELCSLWSVPRFWILKEWEFFIASGSCMLTAKLFTKSTLSTRFLYTNHICIGYTSIEVIFPSANECMYCYFNDK